MLPEIVVQNSKQAVNKNELDDSLGVLVLHIWRVGFWTQFVVWDISLGISYDNFIMIAVSWYTVYQ